MAEPELWEGFAKGLEGGLNKFVFEPELQRQDNRFKMALLSKRIELETTAKSGLQLQKDTSQEKRAVSADERRVQEVIRQRNLNTLTPEAATQLALSLGSDVDGRLIQSLSTGNSLTIQQFTSIITPEVARLRQERGSSLIGGRAEKAREAGEISGSDLAKEIAAIARDEKGGLSPAVEATVEALQNIPTLSKEAAQSFRISARPLLAIQARSKARAQEALNKPFFRTQTVGGKAGISRINPKTGKAEFIPLGLSTSAFNSIAKIEGTFSTALVEIDRLEAAVRTLLGSGSRLSTLPRAAGLNFSAILQLPGLDSETREALLVFTRFKDKFSVDLTALVSGKQMTEKEQKAIKDAMPNMTDSLEFALSAVAILKDTYNQSMLRQQMPFFKGVKLPEDLEKRLLTIKQNAAIDAILKKHGGE